jgi:hypothetical protein
VNILIFTQRRQHAKKSSRVKKRTHRVELGQINDLAPAPKASRSHAVNGVGKMQMDVEPALAGLKIYKGVNALGVWISPPHVLKGRGYAQTVRADRYRN